MEITLKELHCGQHHTVVALQLEGDDSLNVFLQKLIASNLKSAKSLQTSMATITSVEIFRNERKFKNVGEGIYEIKVPGTRLYCFKDKIDGMDAKFIIATNGGGKNNKKEQNSDIKRASQLRSRFLAAKAREDTELNYQKISHEN